MQGLACGSGEIEEQISAFGGGETDTPDFDGSGEQTLIAADLDERLVIGKIQVEEAAVRYVDDAEAIEARLGLEEWANFAVDEDAVGVELRHPRVLGIVRRGVIELAVGGEVAIVEDERELVSTGGQMEGILNCVADKEHAKEARVTVETVNAHGMVVIPEGGGVLLEGVGADARFAGDEPVFGISVVFRGDLGAVDVDAGANVGDVAAGAVEGVVYREEMLRREVVDPFDLKGMTAASLDNGTEGGRAVAPHAGGPDVAMDLMMDLTHGDAEFLGTAVRRARAFPIFRQWKCVHEGRELENVKHGGRPARGVGHLLGHGFHGLWEAAPGAVEKSHGGGLLKKAAARRTGRGQRPRLRRGLVAEKSTHSAGTECVPIRLQNECNGFVKTGYG